MRRNHITGRIDSGEVFVGGKKLSPERSLAVKNHSPTGFSWGYGGSGPAQLALAILLEFTDEEAARSLYQDFKWDVISRLPQEDFEIEIDPEEWIRGREAAGGGR